jgi:hypothetical protein
MQNTRTEVLREIMAWTRGKPGSTIDNGSGSDRGQQNHVYWLSGMAGTGKSTIARTVARRCHEEGRLGASFFFFSRGGSELETARMFVTTIAVPWARLIAANVRSAYQLSFHGAIASLAHAEAITAAGLRRLDIKRGPLLAADVLSVAGGAQLIALEAHHLAVDLVSWRIIAGDLARADRRRRQWAAKCLRAHNPRAAATAVVPCPVPTAGAACGTTHCALACAAGVRARAAGSRPLLLEPAEPSGQRH